jgi:hypothetical protein
MNVISFVSYRGHSCQSKESRNAASFVRLIKPFRQTKLAYVKRLSRHCGLDTRTEEGVLEWFGRLAAFVLEVKTCPPPIILVPVPNSYCSLGNSEAPRTRRLADAIASKIVGAIVCDSLRWKQTQQASHLGGSRDPQKLYRELSLTHVPPQGTVVLVDDVVTTGAHLRAAAAKLKSTGRQCSYALCLARREFSSVDAFSIQQALISDRTAAA